MTKRKRLLGLLVAGTLLAACSTTATPTQNGPTEAALAEAVPATITPAPAQLPVPPAVEPAGQCDGQLTPAQTEGPYYKPGTPERASLLEEGVSGTPLLVVGTVWDVECQPIAGAMVDFWQTDGDGNYDNAGFRMRGHQFTDGEGRYQLETVIPGAYPGRTPHIHVKVFGPDGRELMTTQIYLAGISDQIADGIYDPALLAQDLESDADGRRRVAFDFVVPR